MDMHDFLIVAGAGPAPVFDPVLREFLANSRDELMARCGRPGSLVECVNLGGEVPWLWRLTFQTRGLVRDAADAAVRVVERHVVAVRFLPDYLRRADKFEMVRLVEPLNAFHSNIRGANVCVEVYPSEPLVEICESLHALFAWRLRQLAENDALNTDASAWGRANLANLPVDDRPLFGRRLAIQIEPLEEATR